MPAPPDKVGMSFITYVDQDGIPVNSGTIPDRDLQLEYKYGYNQISLELIDDSYSQTVIREAGELLKRFTYTKQTGIHIPWLVTESGRNYNNRTSVCEHQALRNLQC